MIPRQGASIYAWGETKKIIQFTTTREGTFPFLLGWQYGKGYTWCVGATSSLSLWRVDYGPDAYFAMLLYSTGRGIPEDVVMVHKLRVSHTSLHTWRKLSQNR